MSKSADLFVGVDMGTSGVRAVCTDLSLNVIHQAAVSFSQFSERRTDPRLWVKAVKMVLLQLLATVPADEITAICVDATSGTVLLTDDKGNPISQAKMYNDTCNDTELLATIAKHAPPESAAHGASSSLAKAMDLIKQHPFCTYIQHEADWIACCLSGRVGFSDENNALKTGYDPVRRQWPDWIANTGIDLSVLPSVLPAGQAIGEANGWLSRQVGLLPKTLVVAGTTDGCASFLATGASAPGDSVSVLGSTLTIKILSSKPIYSPSYGIYSHRIGNNWLAGGASNTGGAVLANYFSDEELVDLSSQINPDLDLHLDYYPLLKPGERFPINDRHLAPRLSPRPESDVEFLHGMFEGIGAIEKLAFDRLAQLGAHYPRTMRTLGGGTKNSTWTAIRKKILNVDFLPCFSEHAATGAASLAKRGAVSSGLVQG